MMKKILLPCWLVLSMFFSSCDPEFEIVPVTEYDYSVPQVQLNTFNPVVKLFVNDNSSRVVYVGEEFEIKVVLYNMPQLLFAASMDIVLNGDIMVTDVMYDLSNAGYFAKKESTLTVVLRYPDNASKVSFVKSYRNGATPNVSSDGVLFKIRCKALSKSNGTLSFTPSTPVFWRLASTGTVGAGSNGVQFMPDIQSVSLQIRDDLFVP